MCIKTNSQHPLLMLKQDAYKASRPPVVSSIATCFFLVGCLYVSEHIGRRIFLEMKVSRLLDACTSFFRHSRVIVLFGHNIAHPFSLFSLSFLVVCQDQHPLLEIEVNRLILARHIFVDTFSCVVMATLGWWNRHTGITAIYRALLGDPKSMTRAGCEARMFAFHPGSFRLGLFFTSYQLKNMIDTIVWNDGPEYIVHHLLSMIVSGGSIYPLLASYYGAFYLGLSEVSTAVLCVLANFDDQHGVVGLGEAFPLTKVVVGGLFVVSFIVCRCIMWPIASYYFVRDSKWALESKSPYLEGRRMWIRAFVVCLSGLSVLQVAWLGQIFWIGYTELKAMGFLE